MKIILNRSPVIAMRFGRAGLLRRGSIDRKSDDRGLSLYIYIYI